jgi:hypothetical protein
MFAKQHGRNHFFGNLFMAEHLRVHPEPSEYKVATSAKDFL